MRAPKTIRVELTVVELAAVIKAAETGFAVITALGLVRDASAMEVAIRKVRAARPAG
jgi:hypothetical protein